MSDPLLSELAQAEGLSRQADLVALTGLDESWVSNNWENPDWMSQIGLDKFRSLVRGLASAAAFIESQPDEAVRQQEAELERLGIAINSSRLSALLNDEYAQPGHIASALEAAVRLARSETDEELLAHRRFISVFWERERGRCLDAVLDPIRPLITDDGLVAGQARRLLEVLDGRPRSTGPAGADDRTRQVLIHYVGYEEDQATDGISINPRLRGLDRRCEITRRLIRDDDHELLEWYKAMLDSDSHAALIESWMFPAWTGDIVASVRPYAPRRGTVGLRNTADELIHEFGSPRYGTTYLQYLASVYLPRAVDLDPTLGGKRPEVIASALERAAVEPDGDELAREIGNVA